MLFEGGTADTKPRARTREEIIAKYRNTGVTFSFQITCEWLHDLLLGFFCLTMSIVLGCFHCRCTSKRKTYRTPGETWGKPLEERIYIIFDGYAYIVITEDCEELVEIRFNILTSLVQVQWPWLKKWVRSNYTPSGSVPGFVLIYDRHGICVCWTFYVLWYDSMELTSCQSHLHRYLSFSLTIIAKNS